MLFACVFFVGIDIGKYKHQAVFINVSGDKVSPDISFDNTSEGFALLFLSLNHFDKEQPVIGLEATDAIDLHFTHSCLITDGLLK